MTDYYSNEARNSGVDQMAHRKRHRVLIVDDQVAKLLRKEEVKRGTPSASYVVGMSGNTGCREEEVSLASGMNEFISKPFEPRAIARIFERYLDALENPVAPAVAGAHAESDMPAHTESDWSLRPTRPPMWSR